MYLYVFIFIYDDHAFHCLLVSLFLWQAEPTPRGPADVGGTPADTMEAQFTPRCAAPILLSSSETGCCTEAGR